jgi:hypothetical protein
MDSATFRVIWIGTCAATGLTVVVAILSTVGAIPRWSLALLVLLGGLSFSFTAVGLDWISFRPWNIKSTVLLCTIWVIMGALGLASLRSTVKEGDLEPQFLISEPRSIINMKRDVLATLPFWVRYISGHGDTISPVAVMFFIDVTSNVSTPEKIKDYSVAIKTAECGWVYLAPIRMRSVKVLFIPPGGIQKARPLNFTTNGLDYLLGNPIPPFGTVSGWLLFDTRVKCNVGLGEAIEYRISFETFSGKNFEVTKSQAISNTNLNPGNSVANLTGPTFVVEGGTEDLSKSYIKFYSDEIP